MHDTSWWLERAAERFDMPEPAAERLVGRRDRKSRNRRVTTVTIALAIAAAGIFVVVEALRERTPLVPAAGGPPDASDADGWADSVLPSLALWAAFAGVLLAGLALWRASLRPATYRGARRASADHGPAMEATTASSQRVGRQARTGRKEEAMATHVEPIPVRHTARNLWVTVGALVLLALAIVTGIAIGRATVEEPAPAPQPEGLATPAMVQTIDANIAALNAGDAQGYAATWAPEAVLTDMIAGNEAVGVDEIVAEYVTGYQPGDLQVARTSEVVQGGRFASSAFSYSAGSGVSVWEFDDAGLILHQWVIGY